MLYARINTCGGHPKHITIDKWYMLFYCRKHKHGSGRLFTVIGDNGIRLKCTEFNCDNLYDGSWEIVEGIDMDCGENIVGEWCCTRCFEGSGGTVGIKGCFGCSHLIKANDKKNIITCGYPQKKEKGMKLKEALDAANFGDKVARVGCSYYIGGDSSGICWGNGKGSLTYREVFEEDSWYVVSNKVPVTIGDKHGYISPESAEELKRMFLED